MTYLKKDIFQHILSKDIRSFSKKTVQNTYQYLRMISNDRMDYIENVFNFVWQVNTFTGDCFGCIYQLQTGTAIFIVSIIGFYLPQRFRS